MNPDLLKAIVHAAVKAGFDEAAGSAVPLWLAGVVGTALVTTITALFGLLTKTARDYAAKVEALLASQQVREDERDDRYDRRLKDALAEERARYEERLGRQAAANTALRQQYETYRAETEAWLRQETVELKGLQKDATEALETVAFIAEQRAKEG